MMIGILPIEKGRDPNQTKRIPFYVDSHYAALFSAFVTHFKEEISALNDTGLENCNSLPSSPCSLLFSFSPLPPPPSSPLLLFSPSWLSSSVIHVRSLLTFLSLSFCTSEYRCTETRRNSKLQGIVLCNHQRGGRAGTRALPLNPY